MGKEIFVRFHATLWPAMLMALNLPLPNQVYAHGWWTLAEFEARREGGQKHGRSAPPHAVFPPCWRSAREYPSSLGADAQRYLLCREMNFGLDTEFTR